MAFVAISKAVLPVSGFGKGRESRPVVSIGDSGQMRFSTKITEEVIGKCGKLYLSWDADKRELRIVPVLAPPKGQTEESLFPVSRGKDGESKQAYFGAGPLLSHKEIGINYDYKASGTQIFEPVVGKTKDGMPYIVLTIPEGSLTPRPKQERRKKAEAPAPAAAAKPAAADVDDID